MALSRLENFIKNVEGNILYVNPDDLDSTDDINNQGNSLTRPFKTIQRALLEAARFSYQIGINNDKFDKTTEFRTNYSNLKKVDLIKPCLKRYLASNVKTNFRKVEADEFIVATLLPVQRFKKQSDSHVFAKSRGMV